jgi:hypothetical protein
MSMMHFAQELDVIYKKADFFELCPCSYFEFAFNLCMIVVGCNFVEPSNTTLVSFYFSMVAILFSYFSFNCLGYAQHQVDETLKIKP